MKQIKNFGLHIALFVLLICCIQIVVIDKYTDTSLVSGLLVSHADCCDPVCEDGDSSDSADDLIHDFHLPFSFSAWNLEPEHKPVHLYTDHWNYSVWQPPKI